MTAAATVTPLRVPDDVPRYSDEALALQFTGRHAAELRYVAALGKWLLWDGTHWQYEDTLRAFDFARTLCRQVSAQVPPKWKRIAAGVASARTVAAVERLARADRRHASSIIDWDLDDWLFNSPATTE